MQKIKSVILPRDHIVHLAYESVQQISAELFRKFDLTGFRQVRLYDEGSRFELTTSPEWTDHFMKQGYFNYSRLDRNGSIYQSGYFLWDAWSKTTPAYEIVIRDAIENFEGGRGFSILRRSKEWVDKFEFSASVNNEKANDIFLSQIDTLDRFVDYFIVSMSKWIEKAHQAREFLPYVINPLEEYPDTFLPTQILSVYNKKNNALTKRELETIYWLTQGKTVPEVALIMEISSRTVEKFIITIKDKLNCRTLFQIGQSINELKLDRLLQGLRYR